MDILQSLRERYTSKAYDPSFDLSDEQLAQIREILRLSPSSINSQPWAFQLIGRGELKDKLAQHSWVNEQRIKDASHLLVINVYRDVDTFVEERLSQLGEHMHLFFDNNIRTRGEDSALAWLRSQAYISLGVLLTSLSTLGIDSTPMEGFDPEAYDQILGHAKYRPVLAVALGKRSSEDKNQPSITPKSRREDIFL